MAGADQPTSALTAATAPLGTLTAITPDGEATGLAAVQEHVSVLTARTWP